MVKEIDAVIPNSKNVMIKWRMTEWCNYRCSYCARATKNKDLKTINLAEENAKLEKIAVQINNLCKYYSNFKFNIILIGGEVSFFDIPTIVKNFDAKNISCFKITSNFSNKAEFYQKINDTLNDRGYPFQLNVSLHDEYVDVDEFVEKFNKVTATNGKSIEFVVTSTNFDKYERLAELAKKYDIRLQIDACQDNETHEMLVSRDMVFKADATKNKVVYFNDGHKEKLNRSEVATYGKTLGDSGNFESIGYLCIPQAFNVKPNGDLIQFVCSEKEKDMYMCNLLKNPSFDRLKGRRCPHDEGCCLCGYMSLFKTKDMMHNIMKDRITEEYYNLEGVN